jgi:hypothetical protein
MVFPLSGPFRSPSPQDLLMERMLEAPSMKVLDGDHWGSLLT